MNWLILNTLPLNGYEQMALDEALMESGSVPFLRFYRWKGPCVTFGYFRSYREVRRAIPCVPSSIFVRRLTGGGVVVHDGDCTFSFAVLWEKGETPRSLYRKFHGAVQEELGRRGVEVASHAGLGDGASLLCFASPVCGDLLFRSRKVLGGAIYKKGPWMLYQGSLDCVALSLPLPAAREVLKKVVGEVWCASFRPMETLEPSWKDRMERLAAEKYASAAWNERI